MMVSTLVIYDISEDKIRNKVAEICKDYGLARIQWSAFFGKTDRNRREELLMKFHEALEKSEGDVQMYVICDKDMRLKKQVSVKKLEIKKSEDTAG